MVRKHQELTPSVMGSSPEKGVVGGGVAVLGAAAEKRTESRTMPANAATPTRFLARGGSRRRCGAGGGVGRSSDGRSRQHGAAAESGKMAAGAKLGLGFPGAGKVRGGERGRAARGGLLILGQEHGSAAWR